MTKVASSCSAELAVAVRGAVVKLARRLRSERADESLGLSPLFALSTTQAGRDIVHAERQRRQEWLVHMIDSLTDEEREQLRVALPILRRLGSGSSSVEILESEER